MRVLQSFPRLLPARNLGLAGTELRSMPGAVPNPNGVFCLGLATQVGRRREERLSFPSRQRRCFFIRIAK